MPTHDASTAQCRVRTFKEGLLSAIAHDLEIEVTSFEIEVADDGSRLEARFDPRSLRVRHAMVDGRPAPSALSAGDRSKIEANIVKDVLKVSRNPGPIEFRSEAIERDGDRATVRGRLNLAGRSRELVVRPTRDGDEWVCRLRIHQPDYGIKPYTAMLGALKIKPEIEIELRAPAG